MDYRVQKRIDFSAELVWNEIADLRQFAKADPFHNDFTWLSEAYEGAGARFRLRHTYWPNFPFRSDFVECEVMEWLPCERLTVLERNKKGYRSHVQQWSLAREGERTLLEYRISYLGIPWILFPWRLWVDWRVLGRMRDKIAELEEGVRVRGRKHI